MVAFDVFRNNERLCVAGVGDFGVLTAIVSWVVHRPKTLERWRTEGISEQPTELNLQVGGLQNDERGSALHMRWTDATLRLGDEIRIHVVDVSRVDPATTEYRDDAGTDIEKKKTYVRHVAKELGWEIRES
jgi:hypothetical protein